MANFSLCVRSDFQNLKFLIGLLEKLLLAMQIICLRS